MAVDLTQLQAANDALTAAEVSVASDLQTLTATVASLQAIIADDGDSVVQTALDEITASINATIARLTADVAPQPAPEPVQPPAEPPASA